MKILAVYGSGIGPYFFLHETNSVALSPQANYTD
jgi:hypothetical protein